MTRCTNAWREHAPRGHRPRRLHRARRVPPARGGAPRRTRPAPGSRAGRRWLRVHSAAIGCPSVWTDHEVAFCAPDRARAMGLATAGTTDLARARRAPRLEVGRRVRGRAAGRRRRSARSRGGGGRARGVHRARARPLRPDGLVILAPTSGVRSSRPPAPRPPPHGWPRGRVPRSRGDARPVRRGDDILAIPVAGREAL